MNEKMKMTPSGRSQAKLFIMLKAAEKGGMTPPDCGDIFNAVTACWSGLNVEQITYLNNALAEIESVPDGNEIDLGVHVLRLD